MDDRSLSRVCMRGLPDSLTSISFHSGSQRKTVLIEVAEQRNPWVDLVQLWETTASVFELPLLIERMGERPLAMRVYLPVVPPSPFSWILQWNKSRTFIVTSKDKPTTRRTSPAIHRALQDATCLILRSVYSKSTDDELRELPAFFTPNLDLTELQAWTNASKGRRSASSPAKSPDSMGDGIGLIRDMSKYRAVYSFVRWIEIGDEDCIRPSQDDINEVDHCTEHENDNEYICYSRSNSTTQTTRLLIPSKASTDQNRTKPSAIRRVNREYSGRRIAPSTTFRSRIPALLYSSLRSFISWRSLFLLSDCAMRSVAIHDLSLVITADSAPSACEKPVIASSSQSPSRQKSGRLRTC
jgi:hypothetical protein